MFFGHTDQTSTITVENVNINKGLDGNNRENNVESVKHEQDIHKQVMTKYAVFSRGHNKDDIKHGDGTMDKDVDIHERYDMTVTSSIASESDLNCHDHEIPDGIAITL